MGKELFNEVLDTFENEDIKDVAQNVIENFDPYIWHVPASSTGKYHPDYSLGDGGLMRHTVAVVRFLNHMLSVESISEKFTSRQRDLLRLAAIAHDSKKSGNQEDYEKSKWTKFDHPILAAKAIQDISGLTKEEKIFVGKAICSHMGQYNTDKRSNIILPKPEEDYQIILHMADYLASRKDIEMKFDGMEKTTPLVNTEPLPDVNTWRFTFGKYNGKTIPEVAEEDPQYIAWAKLNMEKEPAKTLLKDFKLKE